MCFLKDNNRTLDYRLDYTPMKPDVLIAVRTKIVVFWDMTPCSLECELQIFPMIIMHPSLRSWHHVVWQIVTNVSEEHTISAFRVMTPRKLVGGYRSFTTAYCKHLQGYGDTVSIGTCFPAFQRNIKRPLIPVVWEKVTNVLQEQGALTLEIVAPSRRWYRSTILLSVATQKNTIWII